MFGVCILRAMYTALTIRDVKRSWYFLKPCQTSDIHPSIGWRCIGSSYFGVTGGRLAIKRRAPVGTRTVSASRACSPVTLIKT